MMSDQWDEFSKSVAEQLPRRESLWRFGAILMGTVFAPLGLDAAVKPAADACKAFCKCRNKAQQQQCLAACNECNQETSRLSGSCGTYTCCGAGQSSCGDYCTDLTNDFYNCGACGNVCGGTTPYCNNGTCGECPQGLILCSGQCSDVLWDNANCGACGVVCPEETYCHFGYCDGQFDYDPW
jgi:hypothetical protein